MQTVGLLAPLIWNEKTGNLVSGHQRISILDDAADGAADYLLTMAVVQLTHEQELEANVLLNNVEAQGRFDMPKLSELLNNKAIRIEGTGFDISDVHRLFGDAPTVALGARLHGEGKELTESLREYHENFADKSKAGHVSDADAAMDTDFYLVPVFPDNASASAFLHRFGLDPDERYFDGAAFVVKIDEMIAEAVEAALATKDQADA